MNTVIDRSGRTLFRGVVPRTESGQVCRFAVRRHKQAVYAPTLTDALSGILGERYPTLSVTQRAAARHRHAVQIAVHVQANLMGDHTDGHPHLHASKDEPLDVTSWPGPVPLVLVDTVYAPFTFTTPPVGNVLWLRPSGEWEYATSLADCNLIELAATT